VSIILDIATSKSIIADLNHEDKLSEKNYDVWHIVRLSISWKSKKCCK